MLPRDTCGSFRSLHTCRSLTRGSSSVNSSHQPQITNNTSGTNSVMAELLHAFTHAEERVIAAWTRVGLAAVDRECKWTSFVEGRLWPFLMDYVRLQEAEEMSIAAENDRLFREMFFTALRLKERPQAKSLAHLMEAVLEQSSENACGIGSSLSSTLTGHANAGTNLNANVPEQHLPREGVARVVWETEWANATPTHHEFTAAPQEPAPHATDGCHGEATGSIVLPSFVAVATVLAGRGDDGPPAHVGSSASHTREECDSQQEQHPQGLQDSNSRSPSLSVTPDTVTPHDRAWAAMWQLARNMTHQEVRRNLESELQRMNVLADARLEQLSLLYKQRALLQLPPEQQIVLRSKYAEKLLSGEFYKSEHYDDNNAPEQPVQAPHVFSSALASTITCNDNGPCPTPGPSSGRTTVTRHTCFSTAKDDLDLLSDAIPDQLHVESEIALGNCNQGGLSLVAQEEEAVGRGTIFEVDLGDVMRFGRRQDLSLARIDAETQNIYADIIAQNLQMESQANAELQSMEDLWTFFEQSSRENVLEEVSEEGINGSSNHEEEILSRQNFMRRLTFLRHKYELSVDTGVEGSIAGSGVFSQGGCSNSNATSRRATCSSKSHRSTSSHISTTDGYLNTGYSCGGNNNNNTTNNNSTGSCTMTVPLPAALVRLFTVRSYAPVLAYIISVREQLQRLLLQQHVKFGQKVTQELTEMYRCYYEKTRDAAYYVTPDYSRWLQERAHVAVSSTTPSLLASRTNEGAKGELKTWQDFLNDFTPRTGNDVLQERIAEVQHVVNRAKAELGVLRNRVQILSEVEPLLRRRSEILEQQRAIQEGSRERLLSKKINMARQLLFEENARRQFSRELPRIHEQMEGLLRQWNEILTSENSDPSGRNTNIHNNGSINNNNNNNNSRRLVVYGIDVADLIHQFHEEKIRVALPTRPPHTRGGSSSSRSPPPSASIHTVGFTTPQRTPLTARTRSPHHPTVASASPMPRSVTSGTPQRAKTRSAKKSVSPVAVKRTPSRVREERVDSPTPVWKDFLGRKPHALSLRHGLPPTGKNTTSTSSDTTATLGKK